MNDYSFTEIVIAMVIILAVIYVGLMLWEMARWKWAEWEAEAAEYPEDFYNYD